MGAVLEAWSAVSADIVISPDVDGLVSAALLAREHDVRIVGVYTTQHLLALDDATNGQLRDALWVDHDICHPGIRSIGQHLLHHRPTDRLARNTVSWNPNAWQKQPWQSSFRGRQGKAKDKFPLGTAHLFAGLQNFQPETPEQWALLAHADGTWFALDCYRPNARIWGALMFADQSWWPVLADYRSREDLHERHRLIVDELRERGVGGASRSKWALELPPELQKMTGSQSIVGHPAKKPDVFLERVRSAAALIGDCFGGAPACGTRVSRVVSGTVEKQYPDRIADFDALLEGQELFSYAFKSQNEVRYTYGIDLS